MTHILSAEIFKLDSAAFRLASLIGGLLFRTSQIYRISAFELIIISGTCGRAEVVCDVISALTIVVTTSVNLLKLPNQTVC